MADTARGTARRPLPSPALADAVPGAGVGVGLVAAAPVTGGPVLADAGPVDVATVVLAGAVAAALALRRRRPASALAALDVLVLLWFLTARPGWLVLLTPLVGCYTLAAGRGWRWGAAGAVVTAVTLVVAVRVLLEDDRTVGVVPGAVLLVATATSAGVAVGYHRAVLAVTRARLAREGQALEERALRLAAEERLRIARDLHDVLGHTLATIRVQAGVGLHLIDRRPEQAGEALAAITALCDAGLTDVKAVLGVLRADAGTGGGAGGGTPHEGLDGVGDLLRTAGAAGLRVELDVDGEPRPLPAPVDLAAYRIVQEALTNVLRHAGAHTVRVTLAHRPSSLLVRVRDDGGGPDAPGPDAPGPRAPGPGAQEPGGHGIDGMRERARALSGRLTAGPHPDGGFEVVAELPLPVAATGTARAGAGP